MKRHFFLWLFALALPICLFGQNSESEIFTQDDTLRGSITAERAWWDLTFYDLRVRVNPADSSISGSNTVFYKVLKSANVLQIDLQPPLSILRVEQDGKEILYKKAGKNAYLLQLTAEQKVGATKSLTVFYGGKPKVAVRAPWDGGFSWAKTSDGKPFVATSCQGLGASVWWPCRDHMADEVDSMSTSVTVPTGLTDVSNGRLRQKTDNADGTTTFVWFVKNPINNYGVNVNISNYAHFSDEYAGEKGKLTLDYYVLPENLDKAKKQFEQVKLMLAAFEHWFGAYPFYEDGYKLVEVPYLGMEHQSSVTYGNKYKNGYGGYLDWSGTGWGLKWDYIIIHESGHEWFANNITNKDMADMWIHEGFTAYSESLFVEYHYGRDAGAAYVVGTRRNAENERPIIGKYNVNKEGSSDMYFKTANVLHTIRQIVNDDEKWRSILRGLNRDFYHQTVTTAQIETYMAQKSGKKLAKIFDQYLRTVQIPTLEYKIVDGKLSYRWANCVADFDMPLRVRAGKSTFEFINPSTKWKTVKRKIAAPTDFEIDKNFYVNAANVLLK